MVASSMPVSQGPVAEAVRGFLDGLLRFDRSMVTSLSGLEPADAGQPIIVVLQAYQSLLGGVRPPAAVCAALRQLDTNSVSPLERAHIEVARHLLRGAYDRASRTLLHISEEFPADELALAAGHQVDFLQGSNDTLLSRLSGSPLLRDSSAPAYPYLLAMLAFAYGENREYARAYEAGTRALSLAPHDNPWAVHACAHALFERREHADVSDLLARTRDGWNAESCLLRTHLSWHYALNAMATSDDDILASCTGEMSRIVGPDCSGMQFCDLVSLLWRMRLAGTDVTADFERTLATAVRLRDISNSAFVDVHILLAVIGCGRYDLAREMAREMCAESADIAPHLHSVRRTAVDVAESFLHYCQSDPVGAVQRLISVFPALIGLGGSMIQRDLVLELLVACDRDQLGSAGIPVRPLVTSRVA